MASRVVQQVLRTARTTSKQSKALDRKFAHPFTDDGAGPANMYNSITTKPTPTPPRAAKASAAASTGGTVGKAYATVAPTASGMPLKSAAGKFSMAFDEGPYLKPTLENAVEHVEMLSKLSHGIKASAEQMQKILAVGAMRL